MDIDSFSAVREERWAQLKQLSRSRKLTGAEADQLTRLYQSTAGDLSAVRSAAPEPSLISRLSVLLAQARVWLTGSHGSATGDFRRFFARTLPAGLYRVRWWGVTVSLVVLVCSFIAGWWTLNHPDSLELVGDAQSRAEFANEAFASYYTDYSNESFAAQVWTNNAWLALLCLAFGITAYLPLMLMYNTVIQLGVAGAIMAEANGLDVFFSLIIPHGLLELSAVFVAAGAGLRLFWVMLVPGKRSRGQALAEEGRVTFAVGIGLALALFASGLIEGFVTPSSMPWWLKIVIGIIACAAFWAYVFVGGRAAAREGVTGDVEGDFATELAPVVG
ncbi:stage II sporulation protein M [Demequina sp.]|uniref:stage II sporulation protein M n=1 Tax=Demequina sp. TaxID=2050685 RepID=UPI003D0F59CA